MLEPIVIRNEEPLDFILETFEKYLSFDIEVVSEFNLQETVLPNNPVPTPNFNMGFRVKFEEVLVDIDLKVKKMQGFENRIAEIFGIISPKEEW